MTQRVGSNRIANNAITLDKIASGVLDSASDLYARAHANAAFETANNATDIYARNHANSAFNQANTVFIQANAAFDAANTKVSTGKAIAMSIVFG
jgi:hypothetical protein